MPWDNSVNKNGIIYAAHTTLGVRKMPLTSCVKARGSLYRLNIFENDDQRPTNNLISFSKRRNTFATR